MPDALPLILASQRLETGRLYRLGAAVGAVRGNVAMLTVQMDRDPYALVSLSGYPKDLPPPQAGTPANIIARFVEYANVGSRLPIFHPVEMKVGNRVVTFPDRQAKGAFTESPESASFTTKNEPTAEKITWEAVVAEYGNPPAALPLAVTSQPFEKGKRYYLGAAVGLVQDKMAVLSVQLDRDAYAVVSLVRYPADLPPVQGGAPANIIGQFIEYVDVGRTLPLFEPLVMKVGNTIVRLPKDVAPRVASKWEETVVKYGNPTALSPLLDEAVKKPHAKLEDIGLRPGALYTFSDYVTISHERRLMFFTVLGTERIKALVHASSYPSDQPWPEPLSLVKMIVRFAGSVDVPRKNGAIIPNVPQFELVALSNGEGVVEVTPP